MHLTSNPIFYGRVPGDGTGEKINKNLFFDRHQDHLYITSEKTVSPHHSSLSSACGLVLILGLQAPVRHYTLQFLQFLKILQTLLLLLTVMRYTPTTTCSYTLQCLWGYTVSMLRELEVVQSDVLFSTSRRSNSFCFP